MGNGTREEAIRMNDQNDELPSVLEEVVIEELAIDGICGIY